MPLPELTNPQEIVTAFEHIARYCDSNETALAIAKSVYGEPAPLEAEEEPLLRVGAFCESVGKPPPMIVDGLLAPNSLILLGAQPKHGKTFLALQIADDISSGSKLLGKWDVMKPGPVVYIGMEDGKYRFADVIRRKGLDQRDPPVYVFTGQKDLSTEEGIDWLKQIVEPIRPVLIIIDTVRQAMNVSDWNDAAKVTMKLKPLLNATRTLPDGCSVLLIVHNNKSPDATGGNRLSGSNALQSISDGYIIITSKKRLMNGDLQVFCEGEGRIDMMSRFALQMDTETLEFRYIDDIEVAKHKESANEARYIKIDNALTALGGKASRADIAKQLGLSPDTVYKTIVQMIRAGRLTSEEGDAPISGGKPVYLYTSVPPLYID